MHAVEPSRNAPEHSLSAALRALRDDQREWGASPAVEARLRSAVQSIGAGRRRAQMLSLAAAAVLVLAIALPLWRLAISTPAVRVDGAAAAREMTTAFFPLVAGDVSDMRGRLVRLELPRSALAMVDMQGIGVDLGGTGRVLADVLVSEDGLARAVRFVR